MFEAPKTCPMCKTPGVLAASSPGSWPAFYMRGESVLWINVAGSVENGCWRPTFSEDRLTCWYSREHVFTWAGPAPFQGRYNDVIEEFRESRVDSLGQHGRSKLYDCVR